MNLSISNILKFILSIGIGIFLIWFIQKDLSHSDIDNIQHSLRQIKGIYIIYAIFLGALACVIRAYRWEMLLKPLGYRPRISTLLSSIFIMYVANLIFPRLGEVLRCTILQREDNIPFEKSVGTMIVERLVDMLGMAIIALLGLVLEYHKFLDLYQSYQEAKGAKESSLVFPIIAISLIMIGFFIVWRTPKIRAFIFEKIKGMAEGFKSIFHLENPILFILYSIGIYTIYFLTTYLLYFAISGMEHLTLSSVFVVLTGATLGIGLTQGGIGAFQYIVTKVLGLYNIPEAKGLAYSWASWLIQTANLIFFGIISWIYLVLRKNGKKK